MSREAQASREKQARDSGRRRRRLRLFRKIEIVQWPDGLHLRAMNMVCEGLKERAR
jgi:hypothetical protein